MTGTSSGRVLACEAPAKVNLCLHVTGRRADGYHLLDTLAVFAEAADLVEVAAAAETSLAVSGPFAGPLDSDPADNLVLRAAAALAGRGPGFACRLTKNLPVAAGLGGGSADAAAALRAMAGLCGQAPDDEELARLGLALGADVPMCLRSVPLRARGVGEEIEPLDGFPRLSLVLVNPRVPVSTGEVFRRLGGRFGGPAADPTGLRDSRDVAGWIAATRNDLEEPARAVEPAVAAVLDALGDEPGCLAARMSGSGATCFGVFDDDAAAERAARQLGGAQPGWWVQASPTRERRPELVRTGG